MINSRQFKIYVLLMFYVCYILLIVHSTNVFSNYEFYYDNNMV